MKRITAFLILLIFVFAGCVFADDNAGAFLETGFGARVQGMGGAFTAYADDANAVMYNSAGLVGLKCIQFYSMFSKLYEEVDHNYFSVAIPLSKIDVLGFGYVATGVDGIPQTGWNSLISRKIDTGKTFEYGAKAFVASYGRNISNNFDLGFSLKYLTEELATNNATALGVDLGAMYHFSKNTRIGLNVKNLIQPVMDWSTGNDDDSVPMSFVLGGYTRVADVALALDLEHRNNRDLKYMLGAEYYYIDTFAFRAGISNEKMTLGAGLKYSDISFDYAYIDSTDEYLETNHSFSLGYVFPCLKKKIAKQKEPKQVVTVLPKETIFTDVISDKVVIPAVNPVYFPDMYGHWGEKAVKNVAGLGVFSGRPDGNFYPNGYIKKSEMAKVLLASYKVKTDASSVAISVKLDSDSEDKIPVTAQVINSYKSLINKLNVSRVSSKEFYITWDGSDFTGNSVDDGDYTVNLKIKDAGVVKSKDVPVKIIRQFIKVELPAKEDSEFVDIPSKHWASGIINEAASMGLVHGESDIIFDPDKTITRLDFIRGIAGALRKDGFYVNPDTVVDYKDAFMIPEDAYDDVELYVSVLGNGGDKNGNLNPNAPLKRVESLVILERYLKTSKLIKSIFTDKVDVIEDVVSNVVTEKVVSHPASVKLLISNTNTGKVIYKGTAEYIKGMALDKKVVALRSDKKFFKKTDLIKDIPVNYVIKIDDNRYINVNVTYLDNKVIVRGNAVNGTSITINGKLVYIKPNGKFFSKLIGSSSQSFSLTFKVE